jgi:hypothetical protein
MAMSHPLIEPTKIGACLERKFDRETGTDPAYQASLSTPPDKCGAQKAGPVTSCNWKRTAAVETSGTCVALCAKGSAEIFMAFARGTPSLNLPASDVEALPASRTGVRFTGAAAGDVRSTPIVKALTPCSEIHHVSFPGRAMRAQ